MVDARQGRRSRGGSCPCCPNSAGAARGKRLPIFQERTALKKMRAIDIDLH